MITGHCFERIARQRTSAACTGLSSDEFRALLTERVVERFARLTGLRVLAIPLDLAGRENDEDPPDHPTHPVCAALADSDYCRESWQLHLAELSGAPDTHWHRCDCDRLCAVAPVVVHGRCVAAFKLACPGDMARAVFVRHVELLDVLVENLVAREAGRLARLLPPQPPVGEVLAFPSAPTDRGAAGRASHPQVRRAIARIAARLADPKLTVRRIADELRVHPDYLAHLFATQVGQRMSRYIIGQRVELAKTLLATTDWQIKRIAYETGHANPNWFSYIFRVQTGLSPSEYRQQAQCPSAAALAL